MRTSKLRRTASGSSFSLAPNFQIEVLHEGESLFTTVMGVEHLEQLLDVTGHLQVTSLQEWLTIILEADEAPEFTLSNRRDVTFVVTPTADPVMHSSTLIH